MRPALAFALCLALAPRAAGSPADAVHHALADARKLPRDAAYRTRYLSLYHYPDAKADKSRLELRAVISGWVHHLSREADIASPRLVRDDLLAVVLDDYGWKAKTWEKQIVEPYFHRLEKEYQAAETINGKYYPAGWYQVRKPGHGIDAKEAAELYRLTGSEVPIVRADWWLFYASRQLDLRNKDNHGFGYLDWLQLTKRADVDELSGVDFKKSIKIGRELRAAVEQGRSGVAQHDRQIEWYATYADGEFGYWRTLDTDNNGDGNTATGNLEAKAFKHQAEEIFFGLPNGFPGTFLCDDKGVKQNSAPDFIGGNDSPSRIGRDTRIHVGGVCFHCHTDGGLKSIDDWARNTLTSPKQLEEADYKKFLRLKRQYMSDLEGQLEKGRKRYTAALKLACGLSTEQFATLHAKHYYRYLYQPRTASVLAVELGVTEERLTKALKAAFDVKNVKLKDSERRRLGSLTGLIDDKKPRPLPTTYTEDFFQDIACLVREYAP